jgi:hypothetical protein
MAYSILPAVHCEKEAIFAEFMKRTVLDLIHPTLLLAIMSVTTVDK